MRQLTKQQMSTINGGATACGEVSAIGMVACTGASFWPIGTLIFGPTCMGMVIAVWNEC